MRTQSRIPIRCFCPALALVGRRQPPTAVAGTGPQQGLRFATTHNSFLQILRVLRVMSGVGLTHELFKTSAGFRECISGSLLSVCLNICINPNACFPNPQLETQSSKLNMTPKQNPKPKPRTPITNKAPPPDLIPTLYIRIPHNPKTLPTSRMERGPVYAPA